MTVLHDIVEMGQKTLNVNKVSTEFFYWFWGQHGYKHSGMFIEGAPHLIRWAAKGRQLKNNTIRQYRRHLVNYILSKFGHMQFQDIRPNAVEDYLLEQRLSNSCRNHVIYTLKTVMREAVRDGIIDMIPEFEPFKRIY